MTIEDSISYLRRQFPSISQRVTYDVDAHGEDFCEIFLPNEQNQNLPITITVYTDGCLFSVGRMHNVMGNKPISTEVCASAIRDVIQDKIVFVFGYKNEEEYDNSKAFFHRFFALTGREDDMSDEYYDFLENLKKKPSWLEKKFSKMTGIFEFSTFSDNEPKIIKRL